MAQGTFIAYYRVSTTRQGKSGLGLEAQHSAIMTYLNGGNWDLIEEFTEVESGKRVKNRPALAAALAACRKHAATLVIAKLDRLARNVAFVSSLMESKVKFVIVEMPDANKFTVHIIAAVAEHEAEQISERTKAALIGAPGVFGRKFTVSPSALFFTEPSVTPTVCPSIAPRNLLLYQSLPINISYRFALVRRRKDDTGVGTAAKGFVE
jgi:Resolvase, N terminal domain